MQRVLVGAVKGYRLLLSPWLGSSCRFFPTCSAYAMQALEVHGAAAGSYLTLRRIARCHPGCAGGIDLVPAARISVEPIDHRRGQSTSAVNEKTFP